MGKMTNTFADDIFKRIFLNDYARFRIKFHRNLFLGVQMTITSIASGNGFSPNLRTNAGPVYWRIYAALGVDELMVSSAHG